jgi:hypothetical protein
MEREIEVVGVKVDGLVKALAHAFRVPVALCTRHPRRLCMTIIPVLWPERTRTAVQEELNNRVHCRTAQLRYTKIH